MKIDSMGQLVVTMSEPSMPLNNVGDDVRLVDADGIARSKVSYTADQVQPGAVLRFDR